MAARSLATATISFGLVSIPIRLYSATQASSAISFNLLHAKCGGRLKQQYVCPRDEGEVVERDQMVKGYEFAKDRYVTFTADELKALEEKATQSIDIAEFVPTSRIDPVYFDKAYYLGPEKGGERAYRLLSEAMRETGTTALARYAARGKQYIVQLRPLEGGGLVLQQLLYADEVRPFSEVPFEAGEVKPSELVLAKQIVQQIAVDAFRPEQFKDDVRARIQAQIDRKVAGEEIQLAAPEEARPQVIDLMEALKASLAARGAKVAEPAPAASAQPAPSGQPAASTPPPSVESATGRKPAKRASRAAVGKAKSNK